MSSHHAILVGSASAQPLDVVIEVPHVVSKPEPSLFAESKLPDAYAESPRCHSFYKGHGKCLGVKRRISVR